jgi:hypothetical protein
MTAMIWLSLLFSQFIYPNPLIADAACIAYIAFIAGAACASRYRRHCQRRLRQPVSPALPMPTTV